MLSPTKYPLLLLLFTLVLATMTHAAPAAAGLARRGDSQPYEEKLEESVQVIDQMEEKLEEEKIADEKAGESERPGAYKDIFRKIRTTFRRLKVHEEESGEEDDSRVADKVRKWYKWMVDVKAGNKLQKPNPEDKESGRNNDE